MKAMIKSASPELCPPSQPQGRFCKAFGSSMWPTLIQNDLLRIDPVSYHHIQPMDIIAHWGGKAQQKIVVHRLISKNQRTLYLRGDAQRISLYTLGRGRLHGCRCFHPPLCQNRPGRWITPRRGYSQNRGAQRSHARDSVACGSRLAPAILPTSAQRPEELVRP